MKNTFKRAFMVSAAVITLTSALISCEKQGETPNMPDPQTKIIKPSLWNVAEYDGFPLAGSDTTKFVSILENRKHFLQDSKDEGFTWSGLGLDILKGTGKSLWECGKKKAADAAMKYVTGLIFGNSPDPTMVQLEKILTEINAMQKKLDQMQETMNEVQKKLDEQAFNDFRRDLDALLNAEYAYRNHNCYYYNLLKKATTDEEVESVINKWGESPVSGCMAFEQGFNLMQEYINFKRKYLGCELTVFGLYDLVAFDNFAFENEGYDTREQFRAVTAADFSLGMTMSCIYFNLHQNELYAEYCADALDKAAEYFENHKVIRKDYAVCQISGAYFTMKKDFWSKYNNEHNFSDFIWLTSDSSIFNTSSTSLDGIATRAAYKVGQFTLQEYDILLNYFRSKGYTKKTVMEALEEEQGIKIPEELRPKYTLNEEGAFIKGFYRGSVNTNNLMIFQNTKAEMWDARRYGHDLAYRVMNMRRADFPINYELFQFSLMSSSTTYANTNVDSQVSWWRKDEGIKDWGGDSYTKKETGFGMTADTDMTHYTEWKVKCFSIPHNGNLIAVKPGALKRYSTFWDMSDEK